MGIKLKRESLEACLTCSLCKKLLKDATTISLCLHTFCRRCIYEKFSDEEVDCCPVCNIDLGCVPVEKLRQDHNLQDIRAKIFPLKRKKFEAFEVMPSAVLQTKIKERSLSSLVVDAPRVPLKTSLTGKRSKAGSRKSAPLQGCNFGADEESGEDKSKSSSSHETYHKTVQNKKRGFSVDNPSYEHRLKEDTVNDVEMVEGKADLWTPLNCLVEAANKTKSPKSSFQGISQAKSEPAHENIPFSPLTNLKGGLISNKGDKSGVNSVPASLKRRRLIAARKKTAMCKERSPSVHAVLGASGTENHRRNCPVWFSLVACESQKGGAPLPQISTCYVRIKDAKMPVSFIQKYLVKKLDLMSESEVEIMCWGQPIVPTLELHNLVELWCRKGPTSKKIPATVGSTAKDFVMVLSYCRKA